MSLSFPINCISRADKLDYLLELKKQLIRWNNYNCKNKNWNWAVRFWKGTLHPKVVELERLINLLATFTYNRDDDVYEKIIPESTGKFSADVSALDYIGVKSARVIDPYQNYTTWTEHDPNNKMTVLPNMVTVAFAGRSEDMYIYSDKGIDFFGPDFEHVYEQNISSPAINAFGVWAVTNAVGLAGNIINSPLGSLALIASTTSGNIGNYILYEKPLSFSKASATWINGFVGGQTLFPRAILDSSASAYGTIYIYFYADDPPTNLLHILSLDRRETVAYQYIQQCSGYGIGPTGYFWSGTFQNLDLGGVVFETRSGQVNQLGIRNAFRAQGSGHARNLSVKGGFR